MAEAGAIQVGNSPEPGALQFSQTGGTLRHLQPRMVHKETNIVHNELDLVHNELTIRHNR